MRSIATTHLRGVRRTEAVRTENSTRLGARLRHWELRTRPVHPETARVLQERWAAVPEAVRTPAQTVGRHAVGCDGTHGVFPKCNLTCTQCYHSADANKVRLDGAHAVREVDAQMAFLRERRGPYAHAPSRRQASPPCRCSPAPSRTSPDGCGCRGYSSRHISWAARSVR